jgi:hypothetical protein
MDPIAEAREKDRLRKAKARQLAKENGTHDNNKRNKTNAIININKGDNVLLETINKYKITINDLTTDHSKIHPSVLKILIPLKRLVILKKPTGKLQLNIKPFDINLPTTVFHDPKNGLSLNAANNYVSKLKALIKHLKTTPQQTMECLQKPQLIFDTLKQHYQSPWQYVAPIVSLAKHSPEFMKLIGPINFKIYTDYAVHGSKEYQAKQLEKADKETITPWEDILKIAQNIATTQPFSQAHLITALYTQLPPVRDNYGNIKIYLATPHPIPKDHNLYISSTKTIILNTYKTCKTYGQIIINISEWSPILDGIIKESITRFPRDYLITKDNNTSNQLFAEGHLSKKITEFFNGLSLNTIRHSVSNYVDKNPQLFPPTKRINFFKIMGHNADMHIKYLRAGES